MRSCKAHQSFPVDRVVPIIENETFEDLQKRLEDWMKPAAVVELGRVDGELAASSQYFMEKWGRTPCNLQDAQCLKPWPFCPKCPANIPLCFDPDMTSAALAVIAQQIER